MEWLTMLAATMEGTPQPGGDWLTPSNVINLIGFGGVSGMLWRAYQSVNADYKLLLERAIKAIEQNTAATDNLREDFRRGKSVE